MEKINYLCPKCKVESLYLVADNLACNICSAKFPLLEGSVPDFSSHNDSMVNEKNIGLASHLFESPMIYRFIVNLKTLIAPDSQLGIKEYVKGKDLLNIGCGSNVEGIHLEYKIHNLNSFYGLDISKKFILYAKKNCTRRDAKFCVASVESLPFADNSFDSVVIPFTLHHLPFPLEHAIDEAIRVSRDVVIIFDHIKSSKSWVWRIMQTAYWNLFDGGYQYLNATEWQKVLEGKNVIKKMETGAIGKHVIKLIIKK